MNKYRDRHFTDVYYTDNPINFNNPRRYIFATADTETHLYYGGELLSEEKATQLLDEYGQTWARSNIEVRAWSFQLYVEKCFMCFTNIEDFMTACAMLRLKTVIWYNAKFDFSIFDYYFITQGWTRVDDVLENATRTIKLPHGCYASLQNDTGARYTYTIWHEYLNKNHARKVHKFRMIDLVNVLHGGLRDCLESWNIHDEEGTPIRKLDMDYVNDDIDTCIDYLINDVRGLYYLTIEFDRVMEEISGLSYIKGQYLTAGGLAKRLLLKYMYNKKYHENIELFHKEYPMTPEMDKEFRNCHLYRGGMTLVNPKYQGKIVSNVYKLDVNSMYPHKMSIMTLPIGYPKKVEHILEDNDIIQVIHCTKAIGHVKANMVGIWYDLAKREYTEHICETQPFYIFKEELDEYEQWYDMIYEYDYVLVYQTNHKDGMRAFVNDLYDIKCTTKGTKKHAVKILLNSSYGKLAERVERIVGHYELAEGGYVHYVHDDITIDEKSMLNIVIGSRVTSLARTDLMQKIRKTCNNNPRDNFIYCDTDSIHTLTKNIETDNKKLGMLKVECYKGETYDKAFYLAPKSYIMVHEDYYSGIKNDDTLIVHCKGVSTEIVKKLLYDLTNIEDMTKIFNVNRPIYSLTGINTIGGKALIYKKKYILRADKDDRAVDMTTGETIFYEV